MRAPVREEASRDTSTLQVEPIGKVSLQHLHVFDEPIGKISLQHLHVF